MQSAPFPFLHDARHDAIHCIHYPRVHERRRNQQDEIPLDLHMASVAIRLIVLDQDIGGDYQAESDKRPKPCPEKWPSAMSGEFPYKIRRKHWKQQSEKSAESGQCRHRPAIIIDLVQCKPCKANHYQQRRQPYVQSPCELMLSFKCVSHVSMLSCRL